MLPRLPTPIADAVGLSLRVLRAMLPPRGLQDLERRGDCASCGRPTWFLKCSDATIASRSRGWAYDEAVIRALRSRENYFCLWCGRNYRMRGLASVAKAWLPAARVYEPATFGVFTQRLQTSASSYVTSEYLPGGGSARQRGGPRHEDVEALTFPDGSFDLVVTSEVFEHVTSPWTGFSEIRRVLRPAGRHIFTVPMVPGRPTATRGPSQRVYHIDPLRPEGTLVITDFGDDLPDLLRPLGFETTVQSLPPESPVLRIYESVAV